jgi:hypothetical protein
MPTVIDESTDASAAALRHRVLIQRRWLSLCLGRQVLDNDYDREELSLPSAAPNRRTEECGAGLVTVGASRLLLSTICQRNAHPQAPIEIYESGI